LALIFLIPVPSSYKNVILGHFVISRHVFFECYLSMKMVGLGLSKEVGRVNRLEEIGIGR